MGRVRDRAAPRERGLPLPRRRDLLSDERPVAGARGHLHAVGHPVPGVRRRAVLPAQRDQGRGRVPAAAAEPAGRDQLPARREHPEARDRRCDRGRARVVRPRRRHHDHGCLCRVDEIAGARHTREGRGGGIRARHDRDPGPSRRRRGARAHGGVRRPPSPAICSSSRPSGRRGAGADREPPGAGGRRGRAARA